jgi:hypothetical protein
MPTEPPANGGYMVAGYLVTAGILIGYYLSLLRRARKSVKSEKGPP